MFVPLHLWLLFLWLRLFSLFSIQVLAPPSLFPICGTGLHCHWHLRSFRVEILRSCSCLSLVSAFHSRASSRHCRGFPLHFYSGISLSEFSVITFFFSCRCLRILFCSRWARSAFITASDTFRSDLKATYVGYARGSICFRRRYIRLLPRYAIVIA